ncbi:MAG: response regulator, partial [Pseudomonadota bacterium]
HLMKPARSSLLLETLVDIIGRHRASLPVSSLSQVIAKRRRAEKAAPIVTQTASPVFADPAPLSQTITAPAMATPEPQPVAPPAPATQQNVLVAPTPVSVSEVAPVVASPALAAAVQPVSVAAVAPVTAPSPAPVTAPETATPIVPAQPALDILVAEDNEVNQMVVSQVLQQLGYSFEIFENGQLALEAFKVKAPRLVLMDVSMPVMNGHEATRAIRQFEAEHGIRTPIIGCTAHALTGDKEKCFEAGMDDYLSKPISPATMQAKVSEWLEGTSAALRA